MKTQVKTIVGDVLNKHVLVHTGIGCKVIMRDQFKRIINEIAHEVDQLPTTKKESLTGLFKDVNRVFEDGVNKDNVYNLVVKYASVK